MSPFEGSLIERFHCIHVHIFASNTIMLFVESRMIEVCH